LVGLEFEWFIECVAALVFVVGIVFVCGFVLWVELDDVLYDGMVFDGFEFDDLVVY